VAHPPSSAALTELLDRNRVILGVVIPPGWSAELKADRASPLQVVIDGSDPNTAGNTRASSRPSSPRPTKKPPGLPEPPGPERSAARRRAHPGLVQRGSGKPQLHRTRHHRRHHHDRGCAADLHGDRPRIRERHHGDHPLPARAGGRVFLGKATPYFFITLVDVLVAILMGQVLFGVVMKASFWLMILASTVYILVALSIGLLISVKTQSQLVANQLACWSPTFLRCCSPTSSSPSRTCRRCSRGLYARAGHLLHRHPQRLYLREPLVFAALAELPHARSDGGPDGASTSEH